MSEKSCVTEIPEFLEKEIEEKGGVGGLSRLMMDKDEAVKLSRIYRALAEPMRLRILSILSVQPLCVCLLKSLLGASDSKLSYHLSVLKEKELIVGIQKGSWITYHLTDLGRELISRWVR